MPKKSIYTRAEAWLAGAALTVVFGTIVARLIVGPSLSWLVYVSLGATILIGVLQRRALRRRSEGTA